MSNETTKTIDLTTTYLGLPLASPFIASASPLTGSVESLQRLEQAGAAAAVLPSLFEEQIEHEEMQLASLQDFSAFASPEADDGYYPELDSYNTGSAQYLKLVKDAKQALNIPLIASLNGSTTSGWVKYAQLIEQAGADAIELNIYAVATDPAIESSAIDASHWDLVAELKRQVRLPIAVKIGPYFSSLPSLAKGLVQAGADGLVLFNRFLAPDIDLEQMAFAPALELSRSEELRIALRWIAILRDQIDASLAATGGVHSVDDVVKALLVGANGVAIASALLQHGPEHIETLKSGLIAWMQEHEYESVAQLTGSMSLERCPNPEGLRRANYMHALTSYIHDA